MDKNIRKTYFRIEKGLQEVWDKYKDKNVIKCLERMSISDPLPKDYKLIRSICNYILGKQSLEKLDETMMEEEMGDKL